MLDWPHDHITLTFAEPDGALFHAVETQNDVLLDCLLVHAALQEGTPRPPSTGTLWWRPAFAPVRAAAAWLNRHPDHPARYLAETMLGDVHYWALGPGLLKKAATGTLSVYGVPSTLVPLQVEHGDAPDTGETLLIAATRTGCDLNVLYWPAGELFGMDMP